MKGVGMRKREGRDAKVNKEKVHERWSLTKMISQYEIELTRTNIFS